MPADRLLDIVSLAVLASVAITGSWRALALGAHGVWVLPIDRERGALEALLDLVFLLGVLVWLHEALTVALGWEGWLGTGPLREPRLPSALRWLGPPLAVGGVVLYVLALLDMGASWRFTIDRERAGELITHGVFGLTRNPIYLALVLVGIGVSLSLGCAHLLLLGVAAPFYFSFLIRREERFLRAHYGEAYGGYLERTPRWLRRPGWCKRRRTGGGA